MTGLGERIMGLARQTLEDPRAGARAVLALGVPLPARTAGLLLVAIASAMLVHLGFLLVPPSDDPVAGFMAASPIRTAVMQWVIFAGTVLMVHGVGRACGGRGTLPDALLIVVWLQVMLLGMQLLQFVALLISPFIGALVGLGAFAMFFWLLSSFVAELHGFQSRWAVFGGILAAALGLAMVFAVLLVLVLGPQVLTDV